MRIILFFLLYRKKNGTLVSFSLEASYIIDHMFDYACREIIFKCFFETSTFEDVISDLFSTGDA